MLIFGRVEHTAAIFPKVNLPRRCGNSFVALAEFGSAARGSRSTYAAGIVRAVLARGVAWRDITVDVQDATSLAPPAAAAPRAEKLPVRDAGGTVLHADSACDRAVAWRKFSLIRCASSLYFLCAILADGWCLYQRAIFRGKALNRRAPLWCTCISVHMYRMQDVCALVHGHACVELVNVYVCEC